MHAEKEEDMVLARGPGDSGSGMSAIGGFPAAYEGATAMGCGDMLNPEIEGLDACGYQHFQQPHSVMDDNSLLQYQTSPLQSNQSYTSSPYSSGHRQVYNYLMMLLLNFF